MNDVISISMENTKMGPIPSFSLPPHTTCNQHAPCVKRGCYAWKLFCIRKQLRNSLIKNEAIAHEAGNVRRQVNSWLSMYRPMAFRIHVSGDFFNRRYLLEWFSIARCNPSVKFFAFTKQFDILRSVCEEYEVPKNMTIILSAWIDWNPPADLMEKFPVAWIQDKNHTHEGGELCEGRCSECGKCFNRKVGNDVVFNKH